MKILIVRTWPDQLNLNSYNVQEVGLASALVRAGHQCDIVLYLQEGKSHIQRMPDGVCIYWKRGINILKNGFFPGIRRIMREYDVVQVHEYDQIQSWMIYTFSGARVVLYHGPYFDEFNHGYNAKCRVFDKIFLRFSRKVQVTLPCVAKSPLARDFLIDKGFRNVTSVGVGLNTAVFSLQEGKFSRISDSMCADKINIIYVGKFEKRRNIRLLIDIYRKILQKHKNVHIVMVGNGEQEYMSSVMPELSEMIAADELSYFDKASQNELREAYLKADIMLFPTNYEIFGMVLLEAMYFGVACISSLNGGSSELIETQEDGMIMENFDCDEWVRAADYLIGNSEKRREMQEKARIKIEKNYTWDSIAGRFLKVYEEMV